MKKILSILICLIMIAAVAVSTVSADGRILFEDRFDSSDNDDWIWDPDVTHFEVKNGVLVGDPSAVVHQTQYDIDAPVIRAWDKFSCKVDVRITDYADSTSMGPGLWFRDYDSTYQQKADGEPDAGEIWYYDYDCVSNSLILSGDYFTANNLEPVKYVLPEGTVKIGPDEKPTTFSLGWRIQPGKIECYFNDQKVITYTNVPMDLGMTRPSPILLVNHSCYVEFDNFIVATVDYNLFNETDTPAPVDPGNNGGGQQPAGTKVVEKIETDENGETRIVTEIVADTNANNPSANNGGSNTGDMIVAVAAVMAVAAAGAIVVAKRREH